MQVDQLIVAQAQHKYQSSKTVLYSIKTMTKKVGDGFKANENVEFHVSKEMIGVGVWEIPVTDEKDVFVIGGYSNKTSYVNIKVQKPSLHDTNVQSVMRIPSTALKESHNSYISSINYQNSGLFLTKRELNNLLDGKENIETKRKKNNISNELTSNIVDGNVFAVSIGETSISNLQQPITLLFRNQTELVANDTCKFWDFSRGRYFYRIIKTSRIINNEIRLLLNLAINK